jgi:hypothetical protein
MTTFNSSISDKLNRISKDQLGYDIAFLQLENSVDLRGLLRPRDGLENLPGHGLHGEMSSRKRSDVCKLSRQLGINHLEFH